MVPRFATLNMGNLLLRNPKLFANGALGHSSLKPSNCVRNGVGNLSLPISLTTWSHAQSKSEGMSDIFTRRNPLKVLGVIVCLTAINVIHLRFGPLRANQEGLCYEAMNTGAPFNKSILRETYVEVTPAPPGSPEYAPNLGTPGRASPHHASKIAHGISIFVAINGTPLLK